MSPEEVLFFPLQHAEPGRSREATPLALTLNL